ncbi:ABC transporter ATP-binding protein [Trueperella pecoris]|uniref:ABC transporter ATP-binding protein n=1 Tax=Trueperella pecoris TaxID=2733571 RepID=A0A7M1QXD8_9ACTO|nr:ABC transporter ATP-binding protein [Trueperella pecoris]QOR46772.1 ABC transporter ATP-binding protein [Trueperella pecoris]
MLRVSDVHFAYDKNPVLKGVSLDLGAGEILTILGPNGAGKTTLLEIILGTYTPSAGSVSIFGQPPNTTNWDRIGLVQQHWSDHSKWRVIDQLSWAEQAFKATGRATQNIDDLLEEVGLTEKKKAKLGKLSGGQRRRADVATALIGSPDLLILDEPTTGLDPAGKIQLHDLIAHAADHGTAVLLTTHDLNEAEKLSNRIVIIDDGVVAATGTASELRERFLRPAEVTWIEGGQRRVHATDHVEGFVSSLDLTSISGLTISRPTLEDAYLELVGHTHASN